MSSRSRAEGWFFLVGFMGAGKTTLGSIVAQRLSMNFVDLDERLVREAGMSIPEIFETEGEGGFRQRETDMLRKLIAEEPAGIMATGGGAFTRDVNRELMRQAGVSIWLDVPIGEIVKRASGAERPLWRTEDEVRALAERRKKDYLLANHRLELGTDPPDTGAIRLYELLARYHHES